MVLDERLVTVQMENFNTIRSLLHTEVSGIYGTELLRDMKEIINLYDIYQRGSKFTPEQNKDFVGANLRYKIIAGLIDKEARFLFSIPPDISIKPRDEKDARDKENISQMQGFVRDVLERCGFDGKLVKGAKDCFIGRRIALALNLNEEYGFMVSFIPSLEFVFETDPNNVDKLIKFVQFYNTAASDNKDSQRIYKKKYWMAEDGYCHFSEGVYDGAGRLVEETYEDEATLFPYIPVWIIQNDGLSGDPFGVSEIESLEDQESWYSKLSSKDMDSIRKGADQIKYTIDISESSTEGLSVNAGAFWDLSTDHTAAEGVQGQVGVLDNDMSYSSALETTLKRLKSSMYEQVEVPDTTSDALQGIVTSGKTLKAIYWGLIVRCNEKMLAWRPAIRNLVGAIIEGAEHYPEIRRMYTESDLKVNNGFLVDVENNYPLPEDETEEKENDILEVSSKVMSRKAYMQKWRGLTDEEADEELRQLQLEKQLFEDDTFGSEFGTVDEE